MRRIIKCALAASILLGMGWLPAHAQYQYGDTGADPPQILSSDLAPTTLLETPMTIYADFVIVDSDWVSSVLINGEPQEFEVGATVVISKIFTISQQRTVIEVLATDEAGNTRTVEYEVLVASLYEPPFLRSWFVEGFAALEIDDNPSSDLSSPLKIKGIDLEGVVPDEEQSDTRTTLRLLGGLSGEQWNAFLGAVRQTYGKTENEKFETQMVFLGVGFHFDGLEEDNWITRYQFLDIEIGNFDYSQQHTLTPGYEFISEGNKGTSRDLLALDIIFKDFAQSNVDNVIQYTLKWVNRWRDPKGQDTSSGNLRAGQSSEGFERTEFDFLGFDLDWLWRWDLGPRLEVGGGYELRTYPNDEPLTTETVFSSIRADNLLRLSLEPGWQFGDGIFVKIGYQYLTNLSNKSPYIRQIYGISAQAAF